MKILVAGGAGFIGSTVASAARRAGHQVVLLDNLSTGRREFFRDMPHHVGDIADGELLDRVFAEHPDIALVVHCAALIVVPDSVRDPVRYYRENVVKTLTMVEGMLRNGCHRLVFSSSAAIYGPAEDLTVDESSVIAPSSPYGRTKAVVEQMLGDIAGGTDLRVLSLRYFNPVGADPRLETGLQLAVPSHALGQILTAHSLGVPFKVTGLDYPTRDGSGLRDYVHVWDLALAHLRALETFDSLLVDSRPVTALNLGTGRGTTVLELVDAFNRLVERPVGVEIGPRRDGDVAGAYTRIDRARDALGWSAELSLEDGIRDTLRWFAIRHEVLPDLR